MSAVDEIKQRIDIVDVVRRYTQLVKSGRNFRALCPFHTEKTPSFFVFPDRQSWHCFGACSTGGDAFAFVMKKENIGFAEALRRLAEQANVSLPSRREPDIQRDARERLYAANEAAVNYYHHLLASTPAGEKARAYLHGRGLDDATINRFLLGYALDSWDGLKQHLLQIGYNEPDLLEVGLLSSAENGRTYDRWRDRLMIPIKDEKGRTIGFGARVLGTVTQGPKYINSPQTPIFDKSATLYGLNLAAPEIRRQDLAVIVEGYMDVMAAHQHGFGNVVASMGTSITEKQIATLKKLSRNVALALDSDAAGEEAMLRCVTHENTLEAEVKVIVMPPGKDPDDIINADTGAWQRLVAGATPVIDYTFDALSRRLDLTKARDRAAMLERLLPFVAEIKDIPTFIWRRHRYLQRLARMTGVSEKDLEAAVVKTKVVPRREVVTLREDTGEIENANTLVASPLEEYCLALLLNHPELRTRGLEIPPHYFENSENREIFLVWRENSGSPVQAVKDGIDVALHEHFERVVNRHIPLTAIEQKYADCVLRLREKYLRNQEKALETLLALEAETGGTAAELAKLQEQGRTISAELKQVFALKARRQEEPRR